MSNIPLATYPDAIKRAVKLIDENKPDDAKRALQAALNMQVVIDTVIPLPIVKAQANDELQFAQALGYGTKKDFDSMYQQLADIREKSADNQSGSGWFGKIKAHRGQVLRDVMRRVDVPL